MPDNDPAYEEALKNAEALSAEEDPHPAPEDADDDDADPNTGEEPVEPEVELPPQMGKSLNPSAPTLDELADELSEYAASHNDAGHRNMFINQRGKATIMDDETAEKFFTQPNFYAYVYDADRGAGSHVSTLQWCDRNGKSIGENVGQPYELWT